MPKPRVLLIGWDAADWKVIQPLLDAGQMPNLSRLIADGLRGNLATLYPVLSPMLWTSIATGKRAYKHGIHGFTEPLPDGAGVRPISLLSRNTKAIWNILNQTGHRSIVVGWWPSHPAEPINGVMVSNHFSQPGGQPGGIRRCPWAPFIPRHLPRHLANYASIPWS
ncbi:MAG: alkaline phosphatase family protein [Verrucomicrobiota bacterium]